MSSFNDRGVDFQGTSQSPVRSRAGGGFVTSPGAFGTPIPPNYNQNKRDLMKNVVPVTIAQVWKADDDEEIKIGNCTAHILVLVGKLKLVERHAASLTFSLDDMTAPPIEVKLWLGFDEGLRQNSWTRPSHLHCHGYFYNSLELQAAVYALFCLGPLYIPQKVPDELAFHSQHFPYVRVIAKLRCVQRKHFLHASRILPLKDANEITMHLLEVIHASMSLQVKQQVDFATNDQMDITVAFGSQGDISITVPHTSHVTSSASYQSAYLNTVNFGTPNPLTVSPKNAKTPQSSISVKPISSSLKGLKQEQQMVLKVISNTKSPIGADYDELFSSLKSLNKHMILQAIEFLINEGHIYNSIDDNHFLATDNELVVE